MQHDTRTSYDSKLYGGHPRKITLRRAAVCVAPHWGIDDGLPRRVGLRKSLFLKNFRQQSASYKRRTRKTTLDLRGAADAAPSNAWLGLRQRPLADLGEAHARADGFGIELHLDQRRLVGLDRGLESGGE